MRNRALSLLLIVASTAVCLVALEGLVRAARLKPPPLPYDNNRADAVLGMSPEPARRWKADFPEYPGALYMQTNNRGFYQERDTAVHKEAGCVRIAFMGDSQTVGTCTARENYPSQFESILNQRGDNQRAGGARFEVLNTAVGRYSPFQYYKRTERDIVPLHPDRLVVALYIGNDFMDSVRQDDRPYLTVERGGGLTEHAPVFVVYSDPGKPPSWVESMRLYQFAQAAIGPALLYQTSRLKLLRLNLEASGRGLSDTLRYAVEVRKLDRAGRGLLVQSLHQYVWFRHFPDTLPRALAVNHEVMRRMRDLCARNGIALTYLLIPTKPLVEPDDMAAMMERVKAANSAITIAGLQSFEEGLIQDTVRAGADLGVQVIDLKDELRNRRAGRRLYYGEDLHLNVTGNAVVASILNDKLGAGLTGAGEEHVK